MMIHYLIYTSRASQGFEDLDLIHLLRESMRQNASHDITGMLLYLNDQFMQYLEGDESDIRTLYGNIVRDKRHHNVTKMLEGSLNNRLFPNWSMGVKKMTLPQFQNDSGLLHTDAFFQQQDYTNADHPALIFLRLFYQKNNRDFKQELVMSFP